MRGIKMWAIGGLLAGAAVSWGADEPCYGHAYDDRVEGEHFWIEWEPELIEVDQAYVLLDAMEAAWVRFVDDLGWKAPHPSIVVAVEEAPEGGPAGICQTRECDE